MFLNSIIVDIFLTLPFYLDLRDIASPLKRNLISLMYLTTWIEANNYYINSYKVNEISCVGGIAELPSFK